MMLQNVTPDSTQENATPSQTSARERAFRRILKTWMHNNHHDWIVHYNIRPQWLPSPFSKRKLELDVFIPEINVAFEINGYAYHSSPKQRQVDDWKRETCKRKGIRLYRIKGYQFNSKEQIRHIYSKLYGQLHSQKKRKARQKPKQQPIVTSKPKLPVHELSTYEREFFTNRLKELESGHRGKRQQQEYERIKKMLAG